MFEKDAEKYISNLDDCRTKDLMGDVFKDGAEFGYNKCNVKIIKAKEIIKDYLTFVKGSHTTVCGVPEENRTINVLKLNKEAEQFLKDSAIDEIIWQTNEGLDFDKIADEVKLTAKQYAMVSDCIERVSANEREFDKDSEEILKEVAEKFKADYKELNNEKAE